MNEELTKNVADKKEEEFLEYAIDEVGKLIPDFEGKATLLGIDSEREKFLVLTALTQLGETARDSRKRQFGK